MKATFTKAVVACSVAAAALFAGSASAATFNQFTFDPIGSIAEFKADKITGNYFEVATFNPGGTFNVSLYWDAGQFVTDAGKTALKSKQTGLGLSYGIYGVYMASGNVSTVGGVTTFNFLPGTGSLKLFLDANNDTESVAPANGSTAFVRNFSSDDVLLGEGDPLSGQGVLNPALSTCGAAGINCGSFGSTTSFALTSAGKGVFVEPKPFYNLSFQSGQLNNFTPTGTLDINGSLDVIFDNAVPEPASLALLGLGILGLGVARRRKQA